MPYPRGLTLFVDADDTLWENNIYFEAVVADYLALAERLGCAPERARARLIEVERERVGRFGYGIANFQASLEQACRSLADEADTLDTGGIAGLCASLRRRAGTHLGEVAATLRSLAGRHRVVLVTKGDGDDQMGKVARSGLRRHLHQVDIVPEKDEAAYRDVLRRHGADPGPELDGRQQPEVRRPARSRGGPRRRVRAPPGHLEPRAGRSAGSAHAQVHRARSVPRLARSVLGSAGRPTVPDDFVHGCGKIAPEMARRTQP